MDTHKRKESTHGMKIKKEPKKSFTLNNKSYTVQWWQKEVTI